MDIQSFLQEIHDKEQKERRIIHRKELNLFFNEDMDYELRRKIIKAWQSSYFDRWRNIMSYMRKWGSGD